MRKNTRTFQITLLFLIGVLLFSSCASTTLITTDPPGAEVYVNDEYLGESPVTYQDRKVALSQNVLRIKKDGYNEELTFFSRDEEPNVGAIIGGFFVFPLWLWALDYKPLHHYKLEPEEK